ncbi:MAG: hypothetical protein ACK484_16795 [Sphingobacteriales bacterium]|jgi:hypothetical protein
MTFIAKYSKWLTLAAAVLLILSCFMDWAYYPDIQKSFTGWFSEKNVYGKPGKWLTVMACFAVIAQFLPYLFLKRTNLFLMALNTAYAFFTFVKYTRSYGITNPTAQLGIYLMLISAILLLITAMFPSGQLRNKGVGSSV